MVRASSAHPIRYAVVGLGYFGQAAILPAFAHAKKNSVLKAFVSGDPEKHKRLGKKYDVTLHYRYEDYDALLKSGEIDAVYIVLPNSMHAEYTVKAAKAGIHVLCEKPMAGTEQECRQMIQAARTNKVKLMIAYRLHFEAANMAVVDLIKKGTIGDPQFFSSMFSQTILLDNIRMQSDLYGGSLWDMGVYCINAARYLFQDEPTEVFAYTRNNNPKIFKGVDEITAATLRFPGDRYAQFTSSFSSTATSQYRIVGTKGDINVDPAYEFSMGLAYQLTLKGKKQAPRQFAKHDQIAPELVYFSDCIQKNKSIEPSGEEGIADVRVVQAIYKSAKLNRPIRLTPTQKTKYPNASQVITKPGVAMPKLVHTESPSGN